MRILLDENIRASFAKSLEEHEVHHVDEVGMKSARNGELMRFARLSYDVLITLDKGLLYQQRHEGDLRVLVVRVPDSTIESLMTRLADIHGWLDRSVPGLREEI